MQERAQAGPQAQAAGREEACRRVRREPGKGPGACDSRDANGITGRAIPVGAGSTRGRAA